MNLKKREGLSNVEDGEFPKENGAQRSNGIGANHRSDRYEERQPDVMDDNPGKSRFTFAILSHLRYSYAYHFFQIWYFIKS